MRRGSWKRTVRCRQYCAELGVFRGGQQQKVAQLWEGRLDRRTCSRPSRSGGRRNKYPSFRPGRALGRRGREHSHGVAIEPEAGRRRGGSGLPVPSRRRRGGFTSSSPLDGGAAGSSPTSTGGGSRLGVVGSGVAKRLTMGSAAIAAGSGKWLWRRRRGSSARRGEGSRGSGSRRRCRRGCWSDSRWAWRSWRWRRT
jgi:hypothetical protein